jgi:hypothetical protein
MTEPLPNQPVASTPEELASQLGWDTQRLWATAAQAFRTEDHVIIVFRETIEVRQQETPEAEVTAAALARNVGSVVMPVHVADELGRVLSAMAAAATAPKTNEG